MFVRNLREISGSSEISGSNAQEPTVSRRVAHPIGGADRRLLNLHVFLVTATEQFVDYPVGFRLTVASAVTTTGTLHQRAGKVQATG